MPRPQSTQSITDRLDRICEIQRDYRITIRLYRVLGTAVECWEEAQEIHRKLCRLGRDLLAQRHQLSV
ncbi:hypothetical protein HAQ00_09300 [Acidithiobacillus caldus ATCC 51756]|nr:hypothetical protein [Acidithiobacillus caldus ATCC 51756]MBU2801664.1 hypothetical protein [Acidithiobacillus caldus]